MLFGLCVSLWLFAAGLFSCLLHCLCCGQWILSGIVITSLGKRVLFALPLDVIGRLCSVIALSFFLLMLRNSKTSFLRCIIYISFIKDNARFITNSRSYTTTELSKLLTARLSAIKTHVLRYCEEQVYERAHKNSFWSIKNSGEVLNKLKSRGFCVQFVNI